MDIAGRNYSDGTLRYRNLGVLAGILLLEHKVMDLTTGIIIIVLTLIVCFTVSEISAEIGKVKRAKYAAIGRDSAERLTSEEEE